MKQAGHKVSVVGGGTLMSDNHEVSECDSEFEFKKLSDEGLQALAGIFGAILAPNGSTIDVLNDERTIDIGVHHGLALYLNGTDLADEVYCDCDSNFVYEECSRLLEGVGMAHSHWQGPSESAIYMYGSDFDVMKERLQPLLQEYPLCQQSRVEKIA